MKIERIKKNHKKEILIGGLIAIYLISAITLTTSKAKYKLTDDIELAKGTINYKPYDFKVMAMYKSDDKTNYTEINEMPGKNYKINESKSYCTTDNINHDNKAKIYTNIHGEHIIESLSKTEKCYIYFDKNTEIVSTTLGNIEVNKSIPDFIKKATEDEGIFKIDDLMYGGTSYYWRGASTTNHVIFASSCWRIVRINGDGTIRLIYNGDVQTGNTCVGNGVNEKSIAVKDITYSIDGTYASSSHVGWTYVEGKQRPEEGDTEIDSNAKIKTEEWYNNNIDNNTTYSSKIADGKFCNDRTIVNGEEWSLKGGAYSYSGNMRNFYNAPLLGCFNDDIYILKVGLITADEVMLAGSSGSNSYYYLYNGQNYWTMTPFDRNANAGISSMAVVYDGGHQTWSFLSSGANGKKVGIRPVINLKSNITISSGNGTLDKPYIVQ